MKIYINDKLTELPSEHITIGEVIESQELEQGPTAVALNEKIVRKPHWETTYLRELDHLTVINAAFGG